MRTSVEVKVCANGYVVFPALQDQSRYTAGAEIYVFESFDALTAWLKAELKTPEVFKEEKAKKFYGDAGSAGCAIVETYK